MRVVALPRGCLAPAAVLLLLAVSAIALDPAAAVDPTGDDKLPRPPILILDDSMLTPTNGVVAGDGTAANPYVIAGWRIDGKTWAPSLPAFRSSPFPPGIYIQGTDEHVVVADNHVLDNPRRQIWVKHAENVVIRDNLLERTAEADRRAPNDGGVHLDSVQDVTVEGNEVRLAGDPVDAGGIVVEPAGPDIYPPFLRSGGDPADVTVANNTVVNTGSPDDRFLGIHLGGVEDAPATGAAVTGNEVRNEGAPGTYEALSLEAVSLADVQGNDAVEAGSAASSAGIALEASSDVGVGGNLLEGHDVGVAAEANHRAAYVDNDLSGHAEAGLWVQGGSDPALDGNAVTACGTGIVVNATRSARMANNSVAGCDRGLSFNGTELAHFEHDVNASNTVEDKPVRYLVGLQDAIIDGAALEAGYLGLVAPSNVTLERGTPDLPANGEGLLLAAPDGVVADAGELLGHETSLLSVGGHGLRVTNLTGESAAVRGTDEVRLDNATLARPGANVGTGLVLRESAWTPRLENLTIQGHGLGLLLEESSGTSAWGVEVTGNDRGILARDSQAIEVSRSNLEANGDLGLKVVSTTDKIVSADARGNWWGHDTGPSGGETDACTGTDADGLGDAIFTEGTDVRVCFDPWEGGPVAEAGDS